MKEFLMRVAVFMGGMFLLSCIAASVATRFYSLDNLGPEHIGLFVAACTALSALMAFIGGKRKPQPEPEPEPAPEPDKPSLQERYEQCFQQVAVPDTIFTAPAVTFLFGPYAIMVEHYIWMRDGFLMLFPTLAAAETAFAQMQPLDADRVPLEPLCIPVSAILYFSREVGDDDGFTLLRYRDALGQSAGIMLSAKAADALQVLLPRADLQRFRDRTYPRSMQQISDIREQLLALKDLWDQSLIEEQEYASKKLDLIAKL